MEAFKIQSIPGPILVIGSSGFIGSNILRTILQVRDDVVGTIFSGQSWRLDGIASYNVAFMNIQDPVSVDALLERYLPKTIFDCSSFGAYSFEQDFSRVHATNYISFINLMETLSAYEIHAYIHAGSSSEYGTNSAGPGENDFLAPNSHYAVSKAGVAQAITYYGKTRGMPVVNLRLYSVYGPYEDSSRLIPTLCENVLNRKLPHFANPNTARDFLYVNDAVDAFLTASLRMNRNLFGESLNIGTGEETTLGELAKLTRDLFGLDVDISFDPAETRAWDLERWFANTEKAFMEIGWKYRVALPEGLRMACEWWKEFLKNTEFSKLTKKRQSERTKNSISVVIACYNDAKTIPVLYKKLTDIFSRLGLDYEIIFVNDASQDDSDETIRKLSAKNPFIMGVTHSRSYGYQAAFKSGLELSAKEACVLMRGDLGDPPELIEDFVRLWREGADVIFGRLTNRGIPAVLEFFYKLFYRVFETLSEFPIPKDAGDFSLLDRNVVYWVLKCREKDYFLRGIRAYVGFRQIGVDYVRSERDHPHERSWFDNVSLAKKAIFSFTRVPLHMLTVLGGLTVAITFFLVLWTVGARFLFPQDTPKGITFMALLIMFFGSAIILGIGILGEYLGKIFEETKSRPPFIRQHLIKRGCVEKVNESFLNKN